MFGLKHINWQKHWPYLPDKIINILWWKTKLYQHIESKWGVIIRLQVGFQIVIENPNSHPKIRRTNSLRTDILTALEGRENWNHHTIFSRIFKTKYSYYKNKSWIDFSTIQTANCFYLSTIVGNIWPSQNLFNESKYSQFLPFDKILPVICENSTFCEITKSCLLA